MIRSNKFLNFDFVRRFRSKVVPFENWSAPSNERSGWDSWGSAVRRRSPGATSGRRTICSTSPKCCDTTTNCYLNTASETGRNSSLSNGWGENLGENNNARIGIGGRWRALLIVLFIFVSNFGRYANDSASVFVAVRLFFATMAVWNAVFGLFVIFCQLKGE